MYASMRNHTSEIILANSLISLQPHCFLFPTLFQRNWRLIQHHFQWMGSLHFVPFFFSGYTQ